MNFDRLAPHYDWMEAVTAGGLLQAARTALLAELAGCGDILSVGEGHGRFAAACARRHPDSRLTCVEASARMLTVARRRLARDGAGGAQVNWVHAVFPEWMPPASSFDAVVTCFFLDCFEAPTLSLVIRQLAVAARRRARWLVVDFCLPPRGFVRFRARAIHKAMYAFFRMVAQLPARRWTPPDAALRANGFELTRRREFDWGLLRADLWERSAATKNVA